MRAVVMAGGRAERFWGMPKPLIKVCGKTMIAAAVKAALGVTREVYVSAPPSAFWAIKEGLVAGADPIITPGLGFPEDLAWVVDRVGTPVLIIPADIPFLTPEVLSSFIGAAERVDASVITLVVTGECFPVPRQPSPIGISLIKTDKWGDYADVTMCAYPELFDVDAFNDLKEVAGLCG